MEKPTPEDDLIPPHGGYRKLKSFQIADLCYDLTVRFCQRYVNPRSRTYDQMVQAARSGSKNIAEGSKVSGTSKETELKLTDVARASLEELKRDYIDYLRQRGLERWSSNNPLCSELISARCNTAEQVAAWVQKVHSRPNPNGDVRRPTYPEIAANAALVLITVAISLLRRQLAAQSREFLRNGGFRERLYQMRKNYRERRS
ncbi:MAG: four helix bundle protein [Verrucomicrobia bacterium]|nr:four helix bundle protein [Verrucomicrobiota bacterium]